MTLTAPSEAPSATVTTTIQTFRDFLEGKVGASALKEPVWGPNGKLVYERTYSRPLFKADGTRQSWTIGDTEGRTNEVWAETCRRVVLGNTSLSPETLRDDEVLCLFMAMLNFTIVPSGRHLWVDGTGLPYSRNCWSAPMGERTSGHFQFLGSRLFEGGGVGANYSNDLLAQTTPVQRTIKVLVTATEDHSDIDDIIASAGANWVPRDEALDMMGALGVEEDTNWVNVPDTREGWVNTWVRLVDTACSPGHDTTFIIDVSRVRPFGSPLVTYGGTASGPAPLVASVVEFERVLSGAVGRRLTSMEAMDLDHVIAASVVAGGARRSARLACKHWADHDIVDFIECKADMSKHWSTNISVEIDDAFERAYFDTSDPLHDHARMVMAKVSEGMAANGEPGFINSSRLSEGEHNRIRTTNPCGEIGLETEGSEFGEACNIGSVNLDRVGTDVEFGTTMFSLLARFLYRATLQSYPGADASTIEARNRRIGAGFMGLQEWGLHHGVPMNRMHLDQRLTESLTAFRNAVRLAADELAFQLGTPRSVKVTTVAPNGSIAKLPGVGAGIHPVIARYAEQRIRFGSADPKVAVMAAKGYPVEPCVYAANTMVVTIPTRDTIMDKGFEESLVVQADEVSLDEFLTMQLWVSDTYCEGTDGNAVSATASIPAGTPAAELEAVLADYVFDLKGTTVFPNATRDQQPITPITKEQYEELVEFCEAMSASMGDDCSTGACPVR